MNIKLYITRGCQACSIMNRLLIKACMETNINPPDVEEYNKSTCDLSDLHDFPTTIIYDNKRKELARLTGTFPVEYIINCIHKAKSKDVIED